MNEKELRELDAWVAEHVMGCKMTMFGGEPAVIIGKSKFPPHTDDLCDDVKHYTTDPAAAMAVLKKCIEKVTSGFGSLDIDGKPGQWMISAMMRGDYAADTEHQTEAETLELAIALFAKKLFTK